MVPSTKAPPTSPNPSPGAHSLSPSLLQVTSCTGYHSRQDSIWLLAYLLFGFLFIFLSLPLEHKLHEGRHLVYLAHHFTPVLRTITGMC